MPTSRHFRTLLTLALVGLLVYFALSQRGAVQEHNQARSEISRAPASNKPVSFQKFTATKTAEEIPDKNQSEEPCWSKLIKKYEAGCGSRCFKETLPRQSLAAKFLNDGWGSKDLGPTKTQSTKLGNFYYALAESGFLWGNVKLPTDYEDALDRLNQIYAADPGNSAPLLFAAAIENQRNNPNSAKEILWQAAQASTKYDSYIVEYERDLYRNSMNDPAQFLEAISEFTSLPFPDYSKLRDSGSLQNDKFAWQLMQGGLDSQGRGMDVEWLPVEYGVGRGVLDPQHSRNDVPTLKSFFDLHRESEEFDALDDILHFGKENCRVEDFQMWTKKLARLLN